MTRSSTFHAKVESALFMVHRLILVLKRCSFKMSDIPSTFL